MENLDTFDDVEVGRRLGHDFYRFSRLPLRPDWPPAVREGYEAAAARRGPRAGGDRFERKWLQLRMGACQRQRAVCDDVTPDLLRELDLGHCPVTREPLTHGLQRDTDWSVDRLNNDGAYAPGNLAVMSVRANRAKGTLSFDEVLRAAQGDRPMGELTRPQWLRLAVLMAGPAFATRQHLAPLLPLVAPLPSHSVRLAMQQIQRLFTLQSARPAGKNALVKAFRQAAPQELQRMRLQMLADAVHEGLKHLQASELCWDVWLQPRVMEALRQWHDALDPASRARAARISAHLAGAERVTRATLSAWHMPTRGYSRPPSPLWPAAAAVQH
ncbi:MAG TPA: hypothetical protein VLA16_01585 [Ideonella sp.]|nr:hypothetical protein [Ideonella sp.]